MSNEKYYEIAKKSGAWFPNAPFSGSDVNLWKDYIIFNKESFNKFIELLKLDIE